MDQSHPSVTAAAAAAAAAMSNNSDYGNDSDHHDSYHSDARNGNGITPVTANGRYSAHNGNGNGTSNGGSNAARATPTANRAAGSSLSSGGGGGGGGASSRSHAIPKHTHIPQNQYRYLAAIINQLKRHRDAGPFLKPVDIVALSIPEYPNIIKNPMDLGTAEDKLTSNQYYNADEVLADIRLIFNNCYKFNGRDSPVSKMAATLERSFNQQLHNLPRVGDTGGSPGAANDFAGNGVGSSAAGTGGGGGSGTDARGRRITQTPSNRYEAAVATPVNKKGRASDPQLKFCGVMIRDFFKRNHNPYALPFHYPVDWRAMNIPDYPFVVKKPMDMSTMRKKIEERHYADASEFEADFRLMLNNCFTYNPPGNPVHQFGRQLEAVFNEKWKDLPPKLEPPPPPAPLPTPTATVAASGGGAKRGGAAQRRLSDVSSDTPQAKPNKNRAKSPRGRDGGSLTAANVLPEVNNANLPAALEQIAMFERKLEELKAMVGGAVAAQHLTNNSAQPSPPPVASGRGSGARKSSGGGAASRRQASKVKEEGASGGAAGSGATTTSTAAAGGAMSGDDGHEPTTKPRKRAATQPAELPELPIDKKNALSVNLGDLDEEKMNGVVEIISRLQPELINGEEEVELDIDNCSNNTLWHLHSYVTGEPLPGKSTKRRATGGGAAASKANAAASAASAAPAASTAAPAPAPDPKRPRGRPPVNKDEQFAVAAQAAITPYSVAAGQVSAADITAAAATGTVSAPTTEAPAASNVQSNQSSLAALEEQERRVNNLDEKLKMLDDLTIPAIPATLPFAFGQSSTNTAATSSIAAPAALIAATTAVTLASVGSIPTPVPGQISPTALGMHLSPASGMSMTASPTNGTSSHFKPDGSITTTAATLQSNAVDDDDGPSSESDSDDGDMSD